MTGSCPQSSYTNGNCSSPSGTVQARKDGYRSRSVTGARTAVPGIRRAFNCKALENAFASLWLLNTANVFFVRAAIFAIGARSSRDLPLADDRFRSGGLGIYNRRRPGDFDRLSRTRDLQLKVEHRRAARVDGDVL